MLTTDAWNAFLKTLEEPPPHVLFVLATTEPHKVPETVRSRVQRFDFRRVPVAGDRAPACRRGEQGGRAGRRRRAELLATAAQGSLRDALVLLEQALGAGERPVTVAVARRSLGLTDPSIAARAGHVSGGGRRGRHAARGGGGVRRRCRSSPALSRCRAPGARGRAGRPRLPRRRVGGSRRGRAGRRPGGDRAAGPVASAPRADGRGGDESAPVGGRAAARGGLPAARAAPAGGRRRGGRVSALELRVAALERGGAAGSAPVRGRGVAVADRGTAHRATDPVPSLPDRPPVGRAR